MTMNMGMGSGMSEQPGSGNSAGMNGQAGGGSMNSIMSGQHQGGMMGGSAGGTQASPSNSGHSSHHGGGGMMRLSRRQMEGMSNMMSGNKYWTHAAHLHLVVRFPPDISQQALTNLGHAPTLPAQRRSQQARRQKPPRSLRARLRQRHCSAWEQRGG